MWFRKKNILPCSVASSSTAFSSSWSYFQTAHGAAARATAANSFVREAEECTDHVLKHACVRVSREKEGDRARGRERGRKRDQLDAISSSRTVYTIYLLPSWGQKLEEKVVECRGGYSSREHSITSCEIVSERELRGGVHLQK